MCRLVAYHGPPLPLSAVLADAPHGLVRQSYAPAEMTGGLLNADGWGVGWSTPGARPGVLKGILPIWADENAIAATRAIESGSFVAIVRSASPGLGVSMANTPPYLVGDHLFAHNGRLWPWPVPLARAVRERVDPEAEAEVRGTTDSEWLAALWRTHLREAPDRGAAGAMRVTLRLVRDLAIQSGGGVSANLVLLGPSGFIAARFADPGPAPSLHIAEDHPRWPGGVMIASEPLDSSDRWRPVPPSTLVEIDGRGVCVEPLRDPGEVS